MARILVGVSLLLLGGGVLVAATQPAPKPARVLAPNAPVNQGANDLLDLSANNSPSVVRNPVNDANLVEVNRIDLPRFACGLHVSLDAGSSWIPTRLPPESTDRPSCYAPDAAFGADGTLYILYVTLEGLANVPSGVWLTTSGDGGHTLSPPLRVLGPLAFQVRITADPVVARRLYLTWLQASATATLAFPQAGNPIRSIRTDDGGSHWSEPAQVSGATRARVVAPSPATGARGQLYVLYLDLGDDRLDYEGAHGGVGGPPYPAHWSLVLARSGDGGRSWTEAVVDDVIVPTQRFVVFTPPSPSLAVHHGSERVYAGFTNGRLGDPDVEVWASSDGGRTFGRPTRVNDTPLHDGRTQHLPQLAVAPNGRLDVVYYDRRADPRDLHTEVSLQSSPDGARTFSRRLVLSDRSFDSGVGPGSERSMTDLGSRLGLVATADRSVAVWTDTRAGTAASAKQDIVRAIAATRREGLSSRVRWAFVAGGTLLVCAGGSTFRPRSSPATGASWCRRSQAGRRVVALPAVVMEALDEHLATYTGLEPEAPLFTGPAGGPLRRASLSTAWREAVKAPGAPDGLRLHDLRHHAATLTARTPGVTTKELMARIGTPHLGPLSSTSTPPASGTGPLLTTSTSRWRRPRGQIVPLS